MGNGGMMPQTLDSILEDWDPVRKGAGRPKVLYTVPTGQNPTGFTMTKARQVTIYEVCSKHDIYILEDNPYYYVHIPSTECSQFAAKLVPSFLSIDTEGPVMRMGSSSKVLAAGSRLGWVTASEQIIEKVVRAHETSVQFPSGISQAVAFKILRDQWSHDGFSTWLGYLQSEYKIRRDTMIKVCEDMLPAQIITWNVSTAGFFVRHLTLSHYTFNCNMIQLWLKVDWQKHPDASSKGAREIEMEIYDKTVEKGALFNLFVRLTHAALDIDAISRFNDALREAFKLGETGNF